MRTTLLATAAVVLLLALGSSVQAAPPLAVSPPSKCQPFDGYKLRCIKQTTFIETLCWCGPLPGYCYCPTCGPDCAKHKHSGHRGHHHHHHHQYHH